MKTLFLLVFLLASGIAIAQPVKIAFYTEKQFKSSMGTTQYDADKIASSFTPVGNTAPVYIEVQFADPKAITAKDRLMLWVYKKTGSGEEYAYQLEIPGVPKKSGPLPKMKSNFTAGEYIARLVDKDDETSVFATATFTVTAGSVPDYKRNSVFVACTSVDDDWNPVGETKSIKIGSCIQFLYKVSKDLPAIGNSFAMWAIRRVVADGSEEYVTDLQQTIEAESWRKVATDNVCEFSKPGTYNIYLIAKSVLDALHGTVGEEYYGKMVLVVK